MSGVGKLPSRARAAVYAVTPPVLIKMARRIRQPFLTRSANARQVLFDGDDVLFKRIVRHASVYGEYGVGLSTEWVCRHTSIPIVSVDTSKDWVEAVQHRVATAGRADIRWVDVGELTEWGRPTSYARMENFKRYLESIWHGDSPPDVVLIDGRWRVAAFLTVLLRARPGTSIIFDDYTNREHYHVVEEFLMPSELCGRQALFVTGGDIDLDRVRELREHFVYVFD